MSTVFALQKRGGREGDGELLWGPRGRQRLDFKGLRCGSEKPNARDPCKKMRPDKRPPNKKVQEIAPKLARVAVLFLAKDGAVFRLVPAIHRDRVCIGRLALDRSAGERRG